MLTNHVITLWREWNGNKGIPKSNYEKKGKTQTCEKYLPILYACYRYQL